VIAYSTMSQIGYMFLAAGIGTYANAEFHLMTHAFFKALLFMAAGLLIHALADEQDIHKMTGIGRLMPRTKWAFLAGSLALVGVPIFAGFFSKDPIIAAAMGDHWYGWILWGAALAGTFLTGLYAFRLYFIVFPGEPSPFVREHHHAHDGKEGAWTMTVPVTILAVLAVIGGWIQWAPFWTPITDWLAPVARTLESAEPTNWEEAISSILAVALGLAGIGLAWLLYGAPEGRRIRLPQFEFARNALERKLYFDEAYDLVFYKPVALLAERLRTKVEEPYLLTVSDIGEGGLDVSRFTRRLQTGLVRTYALALAGGLAILAIVLISVR
jgi:NADH-quinone oxidoreductase subunit L